MATDRLHMGFRRVRVSLFVLLTLGGWLGGGPGEMDAAAAMFSVNTQDDLVDPQPGNGICGDGTFCSLRAAIQEANAVGNTQIYVPAGLYSLLEGQLVITGSNVFIDGEGADKTVLDGNRTTRVIDIAGGAVVMIRGVMVQNGRADKSAVVPAHFHGGGIHNHGTLFLENSALSGNFSPVGGGGGCLGPCGGGLYNASLATLINVTIAYNGADMAGGGIANSNRLDLYNVTLASNLAPNGGGLYNTDTTTLFSTIVANNDGIGPGNNCSSTTNALLQDGGDNLQISYSAPNPQSCGNSIPVADPGIDPVHNANGSAIYYRLYKWSPAIDIVQGQHYAGIDQRAVPRPQDGNGDGIALSDVGAYERQPIDP